VDCLSPTHPFRAVVVLFGRLVGVIPAAQAVQEHDPEEEDDAREAPADEQVVPQLDHVAVHRVLHLDEEVQACEGDILLEELEMPLKIKHFHPGGQHYPLRRIITAREDNVSFI